MMRLLDELFRSKAVEEVLSDEALVSRMLDFEAALAHAEADAGLIPAEAAKQIASCCVASNIAFDPLRAGARKSGNLAIPLIKQLTRAVEEKDREAAKFVHWGATSQDVIDTAVVLQTRDALRIVLDHLGRSCSALRDLTEHHRKTMMPGRTWMQHALPITFGLKTAYMLSALHGHVLRLRELVESISDVQFGGAAGTLAALREDGANISERLATRLDLRNPPTPWHGNRERIAEVATAMGVLCGTLGKIARDIALMTQTEVGELSEPHEQGRGGSSSMPQKSNPVFCVAIIANVTRVPGLVSTVLSSMLQEHERGLGGWHAEWETLPQILSLTGGAAERTAELLSGLEVHADRMRANLDLTQGLIFSEAVSVALAKKVGKSEAHEIVERAAKQAQTERRQLSEVLKNTKEVTAQLSTAEIDHLFDPNKYLGSAQTFINRILAECAEPFGASNAAH